MPWVSCSAGRASEAVKLVFVRRLRFQLSNIDSSIPYVPAMLARLDTTKK